MLKGVLKDVEDGEGKDVELKIVWSKLLYVGEDEDDIVKAVWYKTFGSCLRATSFNVSVE